MQSAPSTLESLAVCKNITPFVAKALTKITADSPNGPLFSSLVCWLTDHLLGKKLKFEQIRFIVEEFDIPLAKFAGDLYAYWNWERGGKVELPACKMAFFDTRTVAVEGCNKLARIDNGEVHYDMPKEPPIDTYVLNLTSLYVSYFNKLRKHKALPAAKDERPAA